MGSSMCSVESSLTKLVNWICVATFFAALVGCDSGPAVDYTKNSSNITQRLSYDDDYPFVGFWKSRPSDKFGLAIDKHRNGEYTVWFCGPGATGEIEMLSPTRLTDDKRFKIIDTNTIEAIDKDGQFDRWMRSK